VVTQSASLSRASLYAAQLAASIDEHNLAEAIDLADRLRQRQPLPEDGNNKLLRVVLLARGASEEAFTVFRRALEMRQERAVLEARRRGRLL
jgi:tetratricopeptide (TPR) repeat protein